MTEFEFRTCPLCGERFVLPRGCVPLTMTFTAPGAPPRCQVEHDGSVKHRCSRVR